MKDNTEAMKQLNEAAEQYAVKWKTQVSSEGLINIADDFKAGALSPQAANGCNKHVEKAKIDFAIKHINECFFLRNNNS